jgi:hypothetical protein
MSAPTSTLIRTVEEYGRRRDSVCKCVKGLKILVEAPGIEADGSLREYRGNLRDHAGGRP